MVHVSTRGPVEADFEDHVDDLAEALDTFSPALGADSRGRWSATITVRAACQADAPAIGIGAFRAALATCGIGYEGDLRAVVEFEEE